MQQNSIDDEKKYQQLFNTLLNGVALHEIICDEQGNPVDYRFLEINPAFETLTGLKAKNLIGKTVKEAMPETEDDWIKTYGKVALGADPVLYENFSIELGKFFEVYVYSPKSGQFITVFSDISPRKEVEQIRQMRLDLMDYSRDHSIKEIMRFTLDKICEITHSPIGFFHYFDEDKDENILQAWSTRTAQEFCEVTIEEDGEHYPTEKAGVWADCLRDRKGIIHNDYPSMANKKGLPEGHAEVLRELAVPVFREEKIVAVLGIGNRPTPYLQEDLEKVTFLADTAWEICELKIADEKLRAYNASLEEQVRLRTIELEKSNEALQSFAYSVAHDLRAPLRGIRGFSEILMDEYSAKLDENAQMFLDKIQDSAKKMDNLILALLDFSRVSNQEIKMDSLDLSRMAHDIVENYKQNTNRKNINISIERGLTAEGDRQLIYILLENLLSNAWKYTGQKQDTTIKFGIKKINGTTTFFIEDNGIGFDMDYADKIFIPFQRLHGSDQFEGTGIGLSTAKQIAHRHQGDIWLESEVNQGTTVYFTLGS